MNTNRQNPPSPSGRGVAADRGERRQATFLIPASSSTASKTDAGFIGSRFILTPTAW